MCVCFKSRMRVRFRCVKWSSPDFFCQLFGNFIKGFLSFQSWTTSAFKVDIGNRIECLKTVAVYIWLMMLFSLDISETVKFVCLFFWISAAWMKTGWFLFKVVCCPPQMQIFGAWLAIFPQILDKWLPPYLMNLSVWP